MKSGAFERIPISTIAVLVFCGSLLNHVVAQDAPIDTTSFLRMQLFVVDTHAVDLEKQRDLLQEHLRYQVQLEEQGIMFAAGPTHDGNDNRLGGLIVIRAASFDDAKRIADNDPMHANGAREYTLRKWTVNEGGFDVTVRFSTQSADFK